MSKTVTALNTISGQVGIVPESYLTHPVLGLSLVEVDPETKSYEPTKYKPQTAAEWRETHAGKVPAKKKADDSKPEPRARDLGAENPVD